MKESIKKILQSIYRFVVPRSIRKRVWYYVGLHGRQLEKFQKQKVKEISERGHINVLFIVCSLPMWRYQSTVEAMRKDPRFTVKIIYTSFTRRSLDEAKNEELILRNFFSSKGLKLDSTFELENNLERWIKDIKFDLIFYCQPYPGIHNNALDYNRNQDKLLGYIPYGIGVIKAQYCYNSEFHNIAWRIYHAHSYHIKTAKQLAANNGKNIRIVGNPKFESDYLKVKNDHIWLDSNNDKTKKRVIWAPHFAIEKGGFLDRAGFLWLYQEMLVMAVEYSGIIQFVFKPHPHLYSVLCKESMWGKEKTDAYYHQWSTMTNTQYKNGDYMELFMTSDALIHDCGSFTGEYLITGKPALFTTKDIRGTYKQSNHFGKKCLDLHYIATTVEEVRTFLDDVVLRGNDPRKEVRNKFADSELKMKGATTAGDNVYKDLISALRW